MNAARSIDAVLAEAKRFAGVTEQPAGSNRGVEVDYFVREAGLDPKGAYPWCACFVGQIGRQALGVAWPCPRTASVAALAAWAKTAGAGVLVEEPARGDLFVEVHVTIPERLTPEQEAALKSFAEKAGLKY